MGSAFVVIGQGPLRHEGFAGASGLEARLRETVRGEVRFDPASRALYATDASNYRQVPIGLVVPRDVKDVVAAVAACREFGAPVLSRGGGTSLAGQTCNVAVVLDFSKYMRGVLRVDAEGQRAGSGRAWVQPGVVLDRLREAAEVHELTFAPDPATHSRCTLGGMIGNNSCGVHALMGGKTVDNIARLEVLLYDGTRLNVGPTSEAELAAKIAAGGREGEIYAGLKGLRDRYAGLVRERFPDIPRRVSGYNLDQLLPENGFNVARALVGSEGTCVTVLEAECELVRSPQHRRLVAVGFSDAFVAADHVPRVLAFGPIGLEGFDGLLVEFMRRKNLATDDVGLLPAGCGGFLLCEFGGNSAAEVEEAAGRFASAAGAWGVVARYDEAEARRVWRVRESALGATVFVPGETHSGWEGWEDSAVRPERLGAYLRDLFGVMARYGYRSPMYGHFGQGCVHLRITFEMRTAEGVARYREFLEEAAECVLRYGGSFSGEHGDGQARAALLPKMFGPELMEAFREFKRIWDPTNGMNPGKLVDPVRVYEPTENLRIGPGYRPAKVDSWFAYALDGGSFSEATTRCVGVGACRKEDGGTMCPSYMATREETHSTRGRAHLLWELMQGGVVGAGSEKSNSRSLRDDKKGDKGGSGKGQVDWRNEEVKSALELCLSCKACKTECPVNVDMATWKAEFLGQYWRGRVHPLRDYGFGFMDRWARLASFAPGVANLGAGVMKGWLGVAKERELPRFAGRTFRSGWKSRSLRDDRRTDRREAGRQEVLLWADTWNNYFYPQALSAAAEVLSKCGMDVRVSPGHVCCGRPLYDFGFLDEARKYLAGILERFEREIRAGVPVVMLEPSCASVFKDELLGLFPDDERARMLAAQTVMLSEAVKDFVPPSLAGREVVVQGHCHQKALMTMKDEVKLLERTGAAVRVLDSGCCGMAGPFGFEREKYAVAQAIGERVLLPAVRGAGQDAVIVGNGFSCREMIAQGGGRRAVHLAEVLAGRV